MGVHRGGRRKPRMLMVSVLLPRWMIEMIDELVKRGVYVNRSEAIRDAITELIKKRCKLQVSTEDSAQDEEDIQLLRGRW